MKALCILAFALMSFTAFAEDSETKEPNKSAHAQAVNAACATDAQTAGCSGKEVGTGLLRCLHAYKKAHKKEFKFSDGCKAAMKEGREARKEKRAERKEKRAKRKAEKEAAAAPAQ